VSRQQLTYGFNDHNLTWAHLFARVILGLIFFMAGFYKVFDLGALQHARHLFVEPYADSFLPAWSLWLTGTIVPFVELIAGALLIAGFRIRDAALSLGGVLILVTFGHLLAEPLFQFHTHVIPRLILLLVVLILPREADRFSVDGILEARRQQSVPSST